MRKALAELPAEQRQTIELAYYGGLFAVRDRHGDGGAARHRQGTGADRAGQAARSASPIAWRRHGRRNELRGGHTTSWRSTPSARSSRRIAAQMERHLATCAACRQAAAQYADRRLAAAGWRSSWCRRPARLRRNLMAQVYAEAAAAGGAALVASPHRGDPSEPGIHRRRGSRGGRGDRLRDLGRHRQDGARRRRSPTWCPGRPRTGTPRRRHRRLRRAC